MGFDLRCMSISKQLVQEVGRELDISPHIWLLVLHRDVVSPFYLVKLCQTMLGKVKYGTRHVVVHHVVLGSIDETERSLHVLQIITDRFLHSKHHQPGIGCDELYTVTFLVDELGVLLHELRRTLHRFRAKRNPVVWFYVARNAD